MRISDWSSDVCSSDLPATGEEIGKVAHAEKADLDRALAAADKGFKAWKKVSPYDRYKVLRKAADIIRGRADEIGKIMSMEQGKPFIDATGDTLLAGANMAWLAEEASHTHGRIRPPRAEGAAP